MMINNNFVVVCGAFGIQLKSSLQEEPNMSTLYVGNLDHDTTAGDLRREFDRYGRLRDVWIARKPPGFAFVEFEDRRDASDAARDMDGRYVLDRRIRVEVSKRGAARGGRDDDRGGERDRGANPRGPPTRTSHRVKISGLPENASWKELKEMLRKDTEPVYVDLRGRGTAVAEFAQAGDVEIAIEKYDDSKLMGSYIRIEKDETDGNERSDSWQKVERPRRERGNDRDRDRRRSRSRSRDRGGRDRGGRDRSRSRDRDSRRSPPRSSRRSPSPETRRPRKDSETSNASRRSRSPGDNRRRSESAEK
jgi:splicing factor, arginine/serine-rich 1